MKLGPIFLALVVCGVLYGIVIERERLMAFLGVTGPSDVAEPAVLEAPSATAAQEGPAGVPVVVLRSEARQIQSGLTVRGRTEASRRVDVRSETTGVVISQPIPAGTEVAEGDLLCRLDPGTRNAQLAEARARFEEARLNDAASTTLVERGFSTETQAAARRAQLEAARAQVEQAEKELERLEIRAPFAGIMEIDTVELGSLLQPGAICAKLMDLREIKLVGFIPEADIERVNLGAPGGARLTSGREIGGTVTFIARSADELTRTYRIEISVPNPDFSIRDGATAEILISLSGEAAHKLPQAALTLDDAGRLGVRIVEDGMAQFREVSLLRDEIDGIWVSGLPDTVEVIVVGQEFVSDGRAVDVTYSQEAF